MNLLFPCVAIVLFCLVARRGLRGRGQSQGPWPGRPRGWGSPGGGGPWNGRGPRDAPWGGNGGQSGPGQGGPPIVGDHVGAPVGGPSGPDSVPDWQHDDRPAAASIGAELFPQAHAQAAMAASPVDVGLAAITAHDPNFDLEQFTQQVQRVFFVVQEAWTARKPEISRQVMADGLWQQHRSRSQGYVDAHKHNVLDNLSVANVWPVAASSGPQYDVITVRVVASSTDYDLDDASGRVVRGDKEAKQWQEDWGFQRSSQAQTQEGGTNLGSQCPNCGAPLDVDLTGTCRYCKVPVMSGQYDWVLARISQVG